MANRSNSDSSADSDPERLTDLRDLRVKLIAAIESADPGALPALARELRLVTAEIADLAPAKESSFVDDLAARRADRLSGADETGGSAKGRKRGSRGG